MTALYNEIEPKAAAWLRELIRQGHIAPGDVDERSIEDLEPDYVARYTQVHLCAGIGVWSYALRRAGWHDGRPCWTASFPCQPFSAAGKGAGFADERHIWPCGLHLIRECRPPVVFGEQVASKDGLGWLDLVQADLEGSGYASGAVDLCAAGVGAPHIRQRLWWVAERVADAEHAFGRAVSQHGEDGRDRPDGGREEAHGFAGARGEVRPLEHAPGNGWIERRAEPSRGSIASGRGLGGLANSDNAGLEGCDGEHADPSGRQEAARHLGSLRAAGGLADTNGRNPGAEREQRGGQQRQQPQDGGTGGLAHYDAGLSRSDDRLAHTDSAVAEQSAWERPGPGEAPSRGAHDQSDGRGELVEGQSEPGPVNGVWRDADWLYCRDGKWRPVGSGSFPLAHGAPARVGRLRGYGNAIVAPAAQAFIEAYEESRVERESLRLMSGLAGDVFG